MAIIGLVQELIRILSETTECLKSDAMSDCCHMAVVAVRGLNFQSTTVDSSNVIHLLTSLTCQN